MANTPFLQRLMSAPLAGQPGFNPLFPSSASTSRATSPYDPLGLQLGGTPEMFPGTQYEVKATPQTKFVLPKKVSGSVKVKQTPSRAAPRKDPPAVKADPPTIPPSVSRSGPYNPPAPPSTDPPASTGGVDLSGLLSPAQQSALASMMAQQSVDAAVKGYQLQQNTLLGEGKSSAMNILGAASALAKLNPNLQGLVNSQYSNAADQLKGIAQGYTGQLQNTAVGEANDIKNLVGGIGGNYTPTTPAGFNTATAPEGMANALYGEHVGGPNGGPAYALIQSGLNAADAARQQSRILQGAGTQSSLMAEGAAQQRANQLNPSIANAESQMPRLTQSYLSSLQSGNVRNAELQLAIQKLGNQVVGHVFGNSASGFYKVNPDGTVHKLLDPTQKPVKGPSISQLNTLGNEVMGWAKGAKIKVTQNGQVGFVADPNHLPVPWQTAVERVMTRENLPENKALAFVLKNSPIYLKQYQQFVAGNRPSVVNSRTGMITPKR